MKFRKKYHISKVNTLYKKIYNIKGIFIVIPSDPQLKNVMPNSRHKPVIEQKLFKNSYF